MREKISIFLLVRFGETVIMYYATFKVDYTKLLVLKIWNFKLIPGVGVKGKTPVFLRDYVNAFCNFVS